MLLFFIGTFLISGHVQGYEYSWNFTMLDSAGDAGKYCSLIHNPVTGYPAVSYTESGLKNLQFAWYNGSGWSFKRGLCDNALYNSLAFNSSGFPAVAFYSDLPSKEIRFAKAVDENWGDPESWNESKVASLGIQISKPDIVFNRTDIPLISYKGSVTEVFLSYFDGGWQQQKVQTADCLFQTSAAVNPLTGWPAVAYQDNSAGEKLKFSEYDGSRWAFPTAVHNSDGYGVSCSLAYNSSGYPGISYLQKNTGILWYAWYNGTGWNKVCVDDTVGSYATVPYTELSYNKSGCPGISYYDGRGGVNGDLKFAFCDLKNPLVWQKETVYSESDSGIYNSFVFDPQTDLPSIAFYRKDAGDLYFAQKGRKPDADFAASVSPGAANMTVSFTDATDSQTAITGWHWIFEDNSTFSGKNPPDREYPAAGTYRISLNASNLFGISEITRDVIVCPYSDFTADIVSGTAPLGVNFTEKCRGSPLVWNWSFGDLAYYNTSDPARKDAFHLYQNAGCYNVSLSCERDGLFNRTTYQGMITVGIGASFTADCISGKEPLTVVFNDTSSGNPDSWLWDFGDGYYSGLMNTTHTFASAGTYNVTLNASSGGFCGRNFTHIYVLDEPLQIHASSGHPDGTGIQPKKEPAKNISAFYTYGIEAGDIVSFIVNRDAITRFSFAAKEDISKIRITIEKISDINGLFKPPKPPVYDYYCVEMQYATESSVMASSVSFDVSRSWIFENGLLDDEICLFMYDKIRGEWIYLPVEFDSMSDSFSSYTARMPGFSYIAIGGEKGFSQMPKNSLKLKSADNISLEISRESECRNEPAIIPKQFILSKKSLPPGVMTVFISIIFSFAVLGMCRLKKR